VARPRDADLIPIGPFPRGANNLAREDSVPATAFRRGVNVDVYPGTGKVRRRKGQTQVNELPTANLWSDGEYSLCTSLDGITLYRFDPDTNNLIELYEGLAPDADVVCCSVNHLVYVSDGVRAQRVDTSDDSVRPWGVPRPAGQPVLSAVDGGLAPGRHQVAVTAVTIEGEESGADVAAEIELPNGGGIRAVMAPDPALAAGLRINVYVTSAGGDGGFKKYGTFAQGFDITIQNQRLGRPLYTFGLDVMPAGAFAGFAGGRLLVAIDNLLLWSQPQFYGLTDIEENYHAYAGHIDMFAPAQPGAAITGVFVASGNKTYFLNSPDGDIKKASNQIAYHAGAVRGMPTYVDGAAFGIDGFPAQPLPMWLAKNGQPCVGLPTGQVVALTNARYQMDIGERVSIAQRELEGINQVIVGIRSPASNSVGRSSDAAEVTVIRNGIAIP